MKTSRIVAKSIKTAFSENPDWMALIASSEAETVEVVFETMQAPVVVASILASSQDGMRGMSPEGIPEKLAWYLDASMQVLPDAVDISLAADGNVLCINVGSGALFLKLTDAAKQALRNLSPL